MIVSRALCCSLALAGMSTPLRAQAGDECRPPRTALVLSGGGATGLAHVGLIRVMDSLGIRPDFIVGSSMGAVVGAMYASGYSGRELDSIVRALPLGELFGRGPALPRPLEEWPHQLAFLHGRGVVQPALPFVKERELNLMLSAWLLEGNLRAAGNFDSLPIPFRAVATDLEHRRAVVLSRGDLARAVRASIAIPVLFRPIRHDGHWLGDGSLTANIPTSIARSLGAERVIVSDATNHLADTLDLERWSNMGSLILSMLLTQAGDSLGPNDVLVRSDVSGMAKFDFSRQAKATLIEKGVAAGLATLPDLRCTSGGAWRAADRRATGPVRVAAGTGRDGDRLRQSAGIDGNEPVDPARLRANGIERPGVRRALAQSSDGGRLRVALRHRPAERSVGLGHRARV
jgi:NTE family protein